MNAWACVRSAVRALRANLLRSALTMLGIVIGVAAVIAMVAVGSGAQTQVAEQIRSLGANLLLVQPGSQNEGVVRLGAGSRHNLTEEDAAAIAAEVASERAVRSRPMMWKRPPRWSSSAQPSPRSCLLMKCRSASWCASRTCPSR